MKLALPYVVLLTLALTACSAGATKKIEIAKPGVVQCVKADAWPILTLLAELAAEALGSALHLGGIDYDAIVDKAVERGTVVGGCAGLKFLAALRGAQPASSMRALVATPNPIDEAEAKIRARLGAEWDLGG